MWAAIPIGFYCFSATNKEKGITSVAKRIEAPGFTVGQLANLTQGQVSATALQFSPLLVVADRLVPSSLPA